MHLEVRGKYQQCIKVQIRTLQDSPYYSAIGFQQLSEKSLTILAIGHLSSLPVDHAKLWGGFGMRARVRDVNNFTGDPAAVFEFESLDGRFYCL